MHFSSRSNRIAYSLAAALLFANCRESAPPLETWSVRGAVVDQNGDSPTDGVVRLLTNADSRLITVGPIQPDGSFTVRTQRQGFEYPGAAPGEYSIVVITSKPGGDGNPVPVRFEVPEPFTVAKTENQLNLEIHR